MVITKPMPSMPVKFWGDDENMTAYRSSYFDMYPGVWRQGDFFKVTERGGALVLGRSDATLNRGGVRIGTAEVYHGIEGIPEVDDAIVVNLDLPGGTFFMPMFVKLADGLLLDAKIEEAIRGKLRREYTPRHVPDKIIQVPLIPMTLTGKKLEVPVRRLLMGVPLEHAANTSAMADPSALEAFIEYARTQRDYRALPGIRGAEVQSGRAESGYAHGIRRARARQGCGRSPRSCRVSSGEAGRGAPRPAPGRSVAPGR
jgi:acetoacetyl-CoA synthetase